MQGTLLTVAAVTGCQCLLRLPVLAVATTNATAIAVPAAIHLLSVLMSWYLVSSCIVINSLKVLELCCQCWLAGWLAAAATLSWHCCSYHCRLLLCFACSFLVVYFFFTALCPVGTHTGKKYSWFCLTSIFRASFEFEFRTTDYYVWTAKSDPFAVGPTLLYLVLNSRALLRVCSIRRPTTS